MERQYRCGECILKDRLISKDTEGKVIKNERGQATYQVFTCDSHQEMVQHLVQEHGLSDLSIMSDAFGWGICTDCGHYFRGDHLPMGHSSAGGEVLWCRDCTEHRCKGYGMFRGVILQILDRHGVKVRSSVSDQELIAKLKELLNKQQ